jgi:hypothetical protein
VPTQTSKFIHFRKSRPNDGPKIRFVPQSTITTSKPGIGSVSKSAIPATDLEIRSVSKIHYSNCAAEIRFVPQSTHHNRRTRHWLRFEIGHPNTDLEIHSVSKFTTQLWTRNSSCSAIHHHNQNSALAPFRNRPSQLRTRNSFCSAIHYTTAEPGIGSVSKSAIPATALEIRSVSKSTIPATNPTIRSVLQFTIPTTEPEIRSASQAGTTSNWRQSRPTNSLLKNETGQPNPAKFPAPNEAKSAVHWRSAGYPKLHNAKAPTRQFKFTNPTCG